jgi:hypothetical protein
MTDHNPDTSKMVPPCPVCGAEPDVVELSSPRATSYDCCGMQANLLDWIRYSNAVLGAALRAHGIETVAQVNALIKAVGLHHFKAGEK